MRPCRIKESEAHERFLQDAGILSLANDLSDAEGSPPLGVLTLKEINLSEVSVFADESGGQSDNAYRAAMGVG